MKFANKHLLSTLLIGVVVAIGAVAVHAHEKHANGEGMHDANRTSITGSPEELSLRARELGEHICANIKAAANCPITPISDKAANELNAMQAAYAQGQSQLHETLTAASLDRGALEQIQSGQAKAIQESALRYMQFLGDAAAALTPDQRQMFSRKGHHGH